jgi:hypothetical protein
MEDSISTTPISPFDEWLFGLAGKTKDPTGWLVCSPTVAAMKLRQGWGTRPIL